MKKLFLIATVLLVATAFVNAQQKYTTRDARIFFNPNKDQDHKDYAAESKEATAVLSPDGGTVALLVQMKTFHFNNALLEEHFNENYLNTDKIPTAKYSGKLIGFNKAMLSKDGTYNISSEGDVTLHGVTKHFSSPVKIVISGKTAAFYCNFKIKAEDYKIDIPGIVKPKLAEETPISATIKFQL